jgi:hypothetical protein
MLQWRGITMTLNKIVVFILIGLALSSKVFALDVSLCGKNDKIFFSCTISNGKKLSLCGVKDKGSDKYSIFYRYGKSGHVEMKHPSNSIGGNGLFTYVNYHRYQVEYSRIYFKNGNYLYAIYQNHDGEHIRKYDARVMVKDMMTDNKNDFQCSVIHKNNMYELFYFLTIADDPEL